MLEVLILNLSWKERLSKFVRQHDEAFGSLELFLKSGGAAIACVDDGEIKQVLLAEFKGGKVYTRGIFGTFGAYSIDVLDLLCAMCSSFTPLVAQHEITLQPKHVTSFYSYWRRSRLGRMSKEESWTGPLFKAKINYPS